MRIFRLKSLIAGIAAAIIILAAALYTINAHSRLRQANALAVARVPTPVILDAGHGGQDGGAVSATGTVEAGINLDITLKTQAIMEFFGVATRLTRVDENSLDYSASATTRANKNADLRARLQIAEENPDCSFLSIHLNKFEQAKYWGAQVFYSPGNAASQPLAQLLQQRLAAVLNPANTRAAKPAPGSVYLMQSISGPAVTIECGFLSNREEEELLRSPEYQRKIAVAIAAGYIDFLLMQ